MKTQEFNENYTIDRRSKGVKAMPKNAPALPEILTADGTAYDANQTYFFFDESSRQIRTSIGLRRGGEDLCGFGLRIIPINKLRAQRRAALLDGQEFLYIEIDRLMEHWNHLGEEAAKEKE